MKMGDVVVIATAIIGLAVVATVIKNPNSVKVINAVIGGFTSSIREAKKA